MLRSMYASVSSMITLQARQSVITNNLANINTTGYKSETLVTKSFDDMLLHNKDSYENGVSNVNELGSLNFGVRIDDTVTSHKQGTLISTENNTDFAILGSGFFQVSDDTNNTYYTRDGSFKVNPQGYLVTNSGHYVMGTNTQTGNSERIYVGTDLISISPDNGVMINGENKYKFNIVDFENYDNLTKYGNNLYTGNGGFNSNSKINLEELIELKRQGYGTTYIAKYFNVALSSVKRYVKRHKDIIFPRVSNILASNVEDENVL